MMALMSEVASAYRGKMQNNAKCFFGCTSRAKLKYQSLVPCWRGAELGSALCSKCHNRLLKELGDASTPLVTDASEEYTLRQRLQGPCFFGCRTSALDNSFKGKMQWHSAPDPCPWPGVPGGSILCNACYNGFRYHATKTGPTLPRQEWRTTRPISDSNGSQLMIEDALTVVEVQRQLTQQEQRSRQEQQCQQRQQQGQVAQGPTADTAACYTGKNPTESVSANAGSVSTSTGGLGTLRDTDDIDSSEHATDSVNRSGGGMTGEAAGCHPLSVPVQGRSSGCQAPRRDHGSHTNLVSASEAASKGMLSAPTRYLDGSSQSLLQTDICRTSTSENCIANDAVSKRVLSASTNIQDVDYRENDVMDDRRTRESAVGAASFSRLQVCNLQWLQIMLLTWLARGMWISALVVLT